jgi:propanol-preferring alcohol dehydrogenase
MTPAHQLTRFAEIEPGVVRLRSEPQGEIPPGWARVAVRACGLCGTDLHLWHGLELPAGASYPVRPGHEVAGVITELGPASGPADGPASGPADGPADGPAGLAPGTEVVLHPLLPCGACPSCLAARPDNCARPLVLGMHRPGGLATDVVWPVMRMVAVPGLDPRQAAILADAVATAHRALGAAALPPGGAVCVLGAGGVGTHVLQLARLADPAVRAVGVVRSAASASRLRDAGFAAELAGDASDAAALRRAGPFDAVVDFSGDPGGPGLGVRLLGRGGTLVLGSVLDGDLDVGAAVRIQTRELVIRGIFASSMADLREVAALACAGTIDLSRSVSHEFGLADAEAAFAVLRDRPPGMLRVVVRPPA